MKSGLQKHYHMAGKMRQCSVSRAMAKHICSKESKNYKTNAACLELQKINFANASTVCVIFLQLITAPFIVSGTQLNNSNKDGHCGNMMNGSNLHKIFHYFLINVLKFNPF